MKKYNGKTFIKRIDFLKKGRFSQFSRLLALSLLLSISVIGCGNISEKVEAVSLEALENKALSENEAYLDSTSIDTSANINADTEMAASEKAYSVEFLGRTFMSDVDYIDIHGVQLADYFEDVGAFASELYKFTNLKKIDMSDCGYKDEDMEILTNIFSDTKFVWRIHMNKWSCKTDAIAFSTFQAKNFVYRMSNADSRPLKYCTDMVCLDLGHNAVTDLSFLENMPNLKIFIIHETYDLENGGMIKDLSALKYCPKLEYLEIFVNHISDLSFLQYLPNVKDLYASNNPIEDVTYLLQMPNLERLYIQCTKISGEDYKRLVEKFPDAKILYYGYQSVWDNGWRNHPRYYAMINMLHTNKVHALFADPEE